MTNKIRHTLHRKSKVNADYDLTINGKIIKVKNPKAPANSDIDWGEIAINYGDGSESLFVKNESGKILRLNSLAHIRYDGEVDNSLGTYLDDRYAQNSNTIGKKHINEDGTEGGEIFNEHNIASGYYSHAEGSGTKAKNSNSHTEGRMTIANNFAEHAEGKFNSSNQIYKHNTNGTYIYETPSETELNNYTNIGNTQSSIGIGDYDLKKNAFEVLDNGNAYVYGVNGYDGTNPTEENTLQKALASGGGVSDEAINLIYNSASNKFGYTGWVDWKGLKEIGWSDKDILNLKQFGANWNTDVEDEAHKVLQADKDLMPMTKEKIQDNIATLTYCPMFDTSNETSMMGMLYKCPNLVSIPLFDTSKVTNMNRMLYNCPNLTSVPLFDTSNVTDMNSMFYGCTNLTTVPLFDTRNVTGMTSMFYNCTNLTTVPLFDTRNVTGMYSMFKGCTNLTSVPCFDTRNVTDMNGMFYNCTNLTTVPLFDTRNVTYMNSMFYGCTNLTTVPLFDTRNVTYMDFMFERCTNLTTVPLFDTRNVTEMDFMFYNCTNLTTVPLFDTRNVTGMTSMFYNCTNLTNLGGFIGLNCALDLSSCTKLTKESLMNVINNAASGVSGVTLTLGADNLAKLTEGEKKIATDKGWTLA